jgi:hypothetical protein
MAPGWLYLHFLDRELLTTCGLYGKLSPRRIHDDFVMSLVSTTEPAYLSTSVLFESDYAFELFSRYPAVFSRQDIVRLAGAHDQLGDFVLRKREDYAEHQSRYSRYFTDAWKEVEDAAPALAVKRRDTTRFLLKRVTQRLTALPTSVRGSPGKAPSTDLLSLVDRLKSTLHRSGSTPVTPSLFEPVFQELVIQDRWRYNSNLQISLAYVESYINDYGGTIPTGLKCGLQVFDGLSRTFPMHCLEVWREILTTLGIYPRILAASAEDLVRIRATESHASFVKSVRRMLERDGRTRATPAARRDDGGAHDTWCIGQRLARFLPKRTFDESDSFVGFVEEVLRQAASALDDAMGPQPGSGDRPPACGRLEEPVFHLDAETGVLKGTDGREVALEERVVRVLVALAGEISGPGRRQPLGKLSDGAVASLYSGARREWTPEEAAKIAYQFTRSLRRSLSRADIRDRDAIVRRLRETGVAMGTRWGRPAVRGKAEVGLFLGRHRDIATADS